MRTSKAYLFTADVLCVSEMQEIERVRSAIAITNKNIRDRAKRTGNKKPITYRVCLKARLGKNNPAASKYRNQWIQSIRLEDAQRIDVYIWERCEW